MLWRKNFAYTCFLSIGVISIIEALILARGLLNFRNFNEWEMYVWNYSFAFYYFAAAFITVFAIGITLLYKEAGSRLEGGGKQIFITTLIMVPIILLSTDLFNMGMRIIQPMIAHTIYGIIILYISIKYLLAVNRKGI